MSRYRKMKPASANIWKTAGCGKETTNAPMQTRPSRSARVTGLAQGETVFRGLGSLNPGFLPNAHGHRLARAPRDPGPILYATGGSHRCSTEPSELLLQLPDDVLVQYRHRAAIRLIPRDLRECMGAAPGLSHGTAAMQGCL